jgi:hypothetical protein
LDMDDAADFKKYNDVVVQMMKLKLREDLKQLKFDGAKVLTYILQDVFNLHGYQQQCEDIDEEADAALFPAWFPKKYLNDYSRVNDFSKA